MNRNACRLVSFLMIAAMLMSLLCACGGGDENLSSLVRDDSTTEAETELTLDDMLASQKNFSYGTYTETYFENEWLNLRFEPLAGMDAAVDTVTRDNSNSSDGDVTLLYYDSQSVGTLSDFKGSVIAEAEKLSEIITASEGIDNFFASIGATAKGYTFGEKGTINIGKDYVYQYYYTSSGSELLLLCTIHDGYCITIRIEEGNYGEYSTEEILGQFESIYTPKNEFTFLYDDTYADNIYGGAYIAASDADSDVVSKAVAERNSAIEAELGIDIAVKKSVGNVEETLRSDAMSGDITYDVIYASGEYLGASAAEGYLGDFNDLPGTDYTQEYWCPTASDDLSFGGKQYLSMNDISMNSVNWADCLFYNKTLAGHIGIEDRFGDPYEMVKNGTWTYDVYLEMLQAAPGVDSTGLLDPDGLGTEILFGCGNFYSVNSVSGRELSSLHNEKMSEFMMDICPVYSNSMYVQNYDSVQNVVKQYDDYWQSARSYFAEDHAMFMSAAAYYTCEESIKNMESDYIMLPYPKYDTAQANYNTKVDPLAYLFAIPSSLRNDGTDASLQRTGAVLEAMAKKSNELLLPAYLDSVVSSDSAYAEQNKEMLELIHSSVRFETTEIMNITEISDTVSTMFKNPSSAYSVYYQKEKRIEHIFNEFNEKINKLP